MTALDRIAERRSKHASEPWAFFAVAPTDIALLLAVARAVVEFDGPYWMTPKQRARVWEVLAALEEGAP